MKNPLLKEFLALHNALPFDIIKPEDLKPAFDALFAETRASIDAIIKNPQSPTFENTVVALERAGYKLSRISGLLFNLNVAETNPEIQSVAREISPMLSEFQNDIILNEALFARIKTIVNSIDKSKLNKEDKRLLEKSYRDFVRNGANLTVGEKEIYREITKELSTLSVDFDENLLAETNDYFLHITAKEKLTGIPDDILLAAEEEAKARNLMGWVFTLQFPSFGPFLKYAENRLLRKEIYFAYNTRGIKENAHNNISIVKRIAELRRQLTNLLGFKTYAEFVLSNRMAETTENVENFIDTLLKASKSSAMKEYNELQQYAKLLGADFVLEAWDWSYYAEKLKKEKFDIDDEITRPYFQLEKVEAGVFDLATSLYGLTFRQTQTIPVYHADVKVFEVFDENNKFLSLLYMDYFPRKGKKGGAWMTEYQQQSTTAKGEDIRPHVSLVFNFSKPTSQKPSLLTFSEVTTLLHEFGHALHGMLSKCTYEELAGTNVYRDFVELPSQLLENWAEQKEWLDKVAVHFESGEKIPREMVQKIIDSKNFNSGYFFVRQLSFAIADLKWHSFEKPVTIDIFDFEREALASTQILPRTEGIALSPAFSHIFSGGYAAGYYSYKWAEVLDADAFSVFKEKGIFNKEVAMSFRENILSKGGTEHPMDLYLRFRGQKPSIEPLLRRSGLK